MEFEAALRELKEEWGPLTHQTLTTISGPSHSELEAFIDCWRDISTQRKREVIAHMLELAEEHFEIDYEDIFRHFLSDSDPVVRRCAIEGLWEDESASLVAPLLKTLSSDEDVDVRASAAISLGRFMYLAECGELSTERGEAIRKGLERVIENPEEDIEVTRRAVESLAFINDDRVRQIIDWAYEQDDERMRESAVFAMGRSGDLYWADTVMNELFETTPAMRYEAARASGELQLARAVGPLIELVNDPDREVQSMAIWALGQIGGERAQQALAQWAESEDELLSLEASEALEELEFATRPLDLFVHDVDDVQIAGTEMGTEEDSGDEDFDTGYGENEKGFEDDFLDLDDFEDDIT